MFSLLLIEDLTRKLTLFVALVSLLPAACETPRSGSGALEADAATGPPTDRLPPASDVRLADAGGGKAPGQQKDADGGPALGFEAGTPGDRPRETVGALDAELRYDSGTIAVPGDASADAARLPDVPPLVALPDASLPSKVDGPAPMKECRDGDRRCTAGITPETCEEGRWVAGQACPTICIGQGACTACKPGAGRCGANQTPESCSENGVWTAGTACSFVCSGQGTCSGSCVPGKMRCQGAQQETCDGTGQCTATPGDCTPPSIVSISPQNGATGVRSDARIVITFSEPMDERVTETAFASLDVKNPTFEWNGTGTIVTVIPGVPLEYANAMNEATPAKTITFAFTSGATDTAGNRLPAASSTFKTLRRITWTAAFLPAQSGYVFKDGTASFKEPPDPYPLALSGAQGDYPFKAIATFDISSLPSSLVEIEQGQVRLMPAEIGQDQVASLALPVNLEHIRYYDSLDAALFATPALRQLGSIVTDASPGWKTADVTAALRDDYANLLSTGGRTRLRLYSPSTTAGGGYEFLSRQPNMPVLSASILAP